MMEWTIELREQGATRAFAHALASVLRGGDVVALEGDLGAGKTTLVRHLAEALGADAGMIASPTYVLMHDYPLRAGSNHGGASRVVHVDAYRLRSQDDLDVLGWDRCMDASAERARPEVILLVEWPDRIEASLPPVAQRATLRLTPTGTESRRLHIQLPKEWSARTGIDLLARPPAQCPKSGAWVSPTSPTYPFASERARSSDLFGWLSGQYRVPTKDTGQRDAQEG